MLHQNPNLLHIDKSNLHVPILTSLDCKPQILLIISRPPFSKSVQERSVSRPILKQNPICIHFPSSSSETISTRPVPIFVSTWNPKKKSKKILEKGARISTRISQKRPIHSEKRVLYSKTVNNRKPQTQQTLSLLFLSEVIPVSIRKSERRTQVYVKITETGLLCKITHSAFNPNR